MKTFAWFFLFCFILLLIICSTGGLQLTVTPTLVSAETTTNIATTNLPPEISYIISDTTLKTWEDYSGNNWIQVIVEITNNGTEPIFLSDGSYDLENSEGKIIAHKSSISECPQVLEAGEKGFMYDYTTLDNPVSGEISIIPHISAKLATVNCVRYPVTEVSFLTSSYYGLKAVGRIENTTELDDTSSSIYIRLVLFDSNGHPIEVLTSYISDELLAGSRIGFEAQNSDNLISSKTITASEVDSWVAYSYPYQYQF